MTGESIPANNPNPPTEQDIVDAEVIASQMAMDGVRGENTPNDQVAITAQELANSRLDDPTEQGEQ